MLLQKEENMNFGDLTNRQIIDISPVINEKIAVFPGDTPFQREEILSFKNNHNLDLSTIKTTVHLGAHTDAPSHYHPDGIGMEKRSLHHYLGACQVVSVKGKPERIQKEDILQEINSPRVLFKTESFPDPYQWLDSFSALHPELIKELSQMGVILVGIDTPSVDPSTDKELQSHNAIYESDMAILEGIVLSKVEPGHYQLIALPLPIEGGDASPVRAVLIPNS